MLNRSLLDDALDAAWVMANPEAARPRRTRREARRIRRAVPPGEARTPDDPRLTTPERARLGELMKTYHGFHRSWTLADNNERLPVRKGRVGRGDRGARVSGRRLRADPASEQHRCCTGTNRARRRDDPRTPPAQPHRPRRMVAERSRPWRPGVHAGPASARRGLRSTEGPRGDGVQHDVAFTREFEPADLELREPTDACPCASGRAVADCHAS